MGKNNEVNVIWKDRKRSIFGLPISFTKYSIHNDRLYVTTGFFKSETNEILLYRILDIKSSRTFMQKLNGVGTITLYSADQSDRTLLLRNIKKPTQVHAMISDLIEQERAERGLVGREMSGTAGLDMDHMDGSCDTHDHGDLGPGPVPVVPGHHGADE